MSIPPSVTFVSSLIWEARGLKFSVETPQIDPSKSALDGDCVPVSSSPA